MSLVPVVGSRPAAPPEVGEQARPTSTAPRTAQRSEPPGGRGTLYLWPEGILFLGEKVRRERHRPFTASLFYALSGSLRVRVEGESGWRTTRAALVAPHVMQELRACCHLAILHIDPETEAYRRVVCRLMHGPVYELPASVVDALVERTRALLSSPAFSPTHLWDLALGLVGDPPGRQRWLDPRLEHVLGLLKTEFLAAPTAARLAGAAGLSERRLHQLFTAQVGLPPQRYILWLRLRHAVYCWMLTRSLTEAAHAAGFADSAHLSRSFRSMFGIRPSSPFRSNGRVRLAVGLPSGPHASSDARFWATAAAGLEPGGGAPRLGEALRWRCIGMPPPRDVPADASAPLPWEPPPDLGEQTQEARAER